MSVFFSLLKQSKTIARYLFFAWKIIKNYQKGIKMFKLIAILATLLTSLPAKILEAAKDKKITFGEMTLILAEIIGAMKWGDETICKIGPNEKKAFLAISENITSALEDRQITISEACDICKNTLKETGIADKTFFSLQ
jgi:hypothetical protein